MKKSQGEATTAKNLDREWSERDERHGRKSREVAVERCGKQLRYKFDRGDDVLDYFDVRKARVIDPQSKGSAAKGKFAYPGKRNSKRPAVVREKSARYRKKT